MRAWFAVAVLWMEQFLKIYISPGSVATRFECELGELPKILSESRGIGYFFLDTEFAEPLISIHDLFKLSFFL